MGSLRKLLTLIWTEWLARKWWFILAGILGALPLLALLLLLGLPLLLESNSEYQGLHIAAACVAALTAVSSGLAAAGVGLSLNLRELTEQRRGFFLAKPLPGHLLWSGKFLAGVGLIIIVILVTALPGTLVVTGLASWSGSSLADESHEPNGSPVVRSVEAREAMEILGFTSDLALIAVPVFPVAFWAGIAMGTRTRWLSLDLVLLLVFGVLAWWTFARMSDQGFIEAARIGATTVAVAAWLAFIAAGARSLASGRLSPKRLHQLLSVTLWPIIGLGWAGQSMYSSWYSHPQVDDLERIEVNSAAPAGSWFEVSGFARNRHGRRAHFLIDSASGKSIRVAGPVRYRYSQVSFSSDGRTAAWFGSGPSSKADDDQSYLSIIRLDDTYSKPAQKLVGREGPLHLSPDGEFCVLARWPDYDFETNSWGWVGGPQPVFRLRSGVPEYAFDLTDLIEGPCGSPIFVDRTTVRCYPMEVGESREIVEVDLLEETYSVVGHLPEQVLRLFGGYSLSPSGEFLVRLVKTSEPDGFEIVLLNARSGAELSRATMDWAKEPRFAWLQTDDRLTVLLEEGHRLEILSTDLEVQKSIDLGERPDTNFVQVSPKILLFGKGSAPWASASGSFALGLQPRIRLYSVDLSRGNIQILGQDLVPALGGQIGSWSFSRISISAGPASPGSKIFYDQKGNLVFFDFESGERRTVLERAT